jgi:hypothetical protein
VFVVGWTLQEGGSISYNYRLRRPIYKQPLTVCQINHLATELKQLRGQGVRIRASVSWAPKVRFGHASARRPRVKARNRRAALSAFFRKLFAHSLSRERR